MNEAKLPSDEERLHRIADQFAVDAAEVADETLSSEGDPKVYEQEMVTLRARLSSLVFVLLQQVRAEPEEDASK